MHQFLLGMLFPFVAGIAVYASRRFRASVFMLVLFPLLMALFGLWAVAPDVPRALGMMDLYTRLATDPRMNMFFWHYTIDLHETDSSLYAIPFVLIWASLLFVAWRELRLRERAAGGTSNG